VNWSPNPSFTADAPKAARRLTQVSLGDYGPHRELTIGDETKALACWVDDDLLVTPRSRQLLGRAAGANEPYFTLKIFEAYALLSAAPAILTLWLVWAVAAVLLWRARRLSGAIFFSFVLSIYFVFGVVDRWLGYLPDLERQRRPRQITPFR
jgi:hypothetical protein